MTKSNLQAKNTSTCWSNLTQKVAKQEKHNYKCHKTHTCFQLGHLSRQRRCVKKQSPWQPLTSSCSQPSWQESQPVGVPSEQPFSQLAWQAGNRWTLAYNDASYARHATTAVADKAATQCAKIISNIKAPEIAAALVYLVQRHDINGNGIVLSSIEYRLNFRSINSIKTLRLCVLLFSKGVGTVPLQVPSAS